MIKSHYIITMNSNYLKTLKPNKAVNIFFSDLPTEEKKKLLEETTGADSLFWGLIRETEASLSTGYDIPLEYTRAFFSDYTPNPKFLKLILK